MFVKLELRSKPESCSDLFACRFDQLQRILRITCRSDNVLKLHTMCTDKVYHKHTGGVRSA
jgi:hypothetical protein